MHEDFRALQDDFQSMAGRLAEGEAKINVLEDSTSSKKKRVEATSNRVKYLTKEISELEDSNGRRNLRIFGLPEKEEDDTNSCVEFLEV
ncbi:hypothetical protein NDU88_004918 [Pleurodeles waltl]|uniref:Uncharacterized protein n=1 Tax=Pleurodeles waltl TaxID=8319 RepID=A0AAV7WTC0_PLEWA|nr:hypothetical protein NDU88_004918 [Pleurodeles waltl]